VSGSETATDIVEFRESGEVKVGIRCLVPDEDYITQEKMKAKRAREVTEWEEVQPAPTLKEVVYRSTRPSSAPSALPPTQPQVIYRHVHMTVPPPPPSLGPRPVKVLSTAHEAVNMYRTSSSATKFNTATIEAQVSKGAQSTKATDSPVIDSNVATEGSSRKGIVSSTAPSSTSKSRHRHGNHTKVVVEAYRPERSEFEIRRLARDEVERYRQAERLMETHSSPYARGRLVPIEREEKEYDHVARIPVERRIAMEKDVAADKPWVKKPERPVPATAPVSRHEYVMSGISPDADRDVEIIYEDAAPRVQNEALRFAEYAQQRTNPSTTSSSVSSGTTRFPGAEKIADQSSRAGQAFARSAEPVAIRPPDRRESALSRDKVLGVPRRYSDYSERRSSTVEFTNVSGRIKPDEVLEFEANHLRAEQTHGEDRTSEYNPRPRKSSELQEVIGIRRDSKLATSHTGGRDKLPAVTIAPPQPPLEIVKTTSGKTPYPRDGSVTPVPMPSAQSYVSSTLSRSPKAIAGPPTKSQYYYVERRAQPSPPSLTQEGKEPRSEYYYVEHRVEPGSPPSRLKSRSDTRDVYYVEEERLSSLRRSPQEHAVPEDHVRGRNRDKDACQRASDISSKVRFAKQVEYSPTPPGSDASSTEFRGFGRLQKLVRKDRADEGGDIMAEYERRSRSRSRVSAEQSSRLWERKSGNVGQGRRGRVIGVAEVDRDRTPRPTDRYRRPSGSSETATLPSEIRPLARAKSESPSRERLNELARRQRKQKDDGIGPYAVEEERSASIEVEDGSISSASSADSDLRYRSEYDEARDRRGTERRQRR
jgi:hypothetical protein